MVSVGWQDATAQGVDPCLVEYGHSVRPPYTCMCMETLWSTCKRG